MTDTQREDFAPSGLQSAPNPSENALGDYITAERGKGETGAN